MTTMAGKRGKAQVQFSRQIRIRIYVYPQDGVWVAESVQFKLMSKGRTSTEALDGLIEAVHAYAETVMARGWVDQFDRKLSRKRRVELWLKIATSRLRLQPARVLTRAVQF